MTDCRDFFVQLFKDENTEYWEFDHEGWQSPADSARFQIKVEHGAATIITGKKEPGAQEYLWEPDEECWPTFEDAAICAIERYFMQDCFLRTIPDNARVSSEPCLTN